MTGCGEMTENPGVSNPEPGVPLTLATERARSIDNVRYALAFNIPADPSVPIEAKAGIRFSTNGVSRPLILDFTPAADHIDSISVGGKPSHFGVVKDHI